ncbi:MAG: hypothetical protein K9M44_00640 [Candidatus Pacebacteria bacterium]|nr:hypothetical protein [Candidatus Paceibacterota bacterium]
MNKQYSTCRVQKNRKSLVKFLNGCILFGLALTLIYYIASVNDLAVKGFDLQNLKSEAKALAAENQSKSARKTSLQALYESKSKIDQLGLVKVDNITYITVSKGEQVAKK